MVRAGECQLQERNGVLPRGNGALRRRQGCVRRGNSIIRRRQWQVLFWASATSDEKNAVSQGTSVLRGRHCALRSWSGSLTMGTRQSEAPVRSGARTTRTASRRVTVCCNPYTPCHGATTISEERERQDARWARSGNGREWSAWRKAKRTPRRTGSSQGTDDWYLRLTGSSRGRNGSEIGRAHV